MGSYTIWIRSDFFFWGGNIFNDLAFLEVSYAHAWNQTLNAVWSAWTGPPAPACFARSRGLIEYYMKNEVPSVSVLKLSWSSYQKQDRYGPASRLL